MQTLHRSTWAEFKQTLDVYASRPIERRQQFWFRGHADAAWPMRPTLDRLRLFSSDIEREGLIVRLTEEFRHEMIRLGAEPNSTPRGDALELLARHHGLPSPHLDWTESPYIAAFFAFREAGEADMAAIWALDRTRISPEAETYLDYEYDIELLRFNRRALQQRGHFIRISTMLQTPEQLLGHGLSRFTIPRSQRDIALADLDEMGLNARTLYHDLSGAADAAAWRILG